MTSAAVCDQNVDMSSAPPQSASTDTSFAHYSPDHNISADIAELNDQLASETARANRAERDIWGRLSENSRALQRQQLFDETARADTAGDENKKLTRVILL